MKRFPVMKAPVLLLLLLCGVCYCAPGQTPLVLKGGTIIDVTDYGNSKKDITDAVVIIEGNTIKAAGSASSIKVPKEARILDVTGKYIVPGLIDCFGIINNQAYANAYLYLGVTTVVLTEDGRRGPADWSANPSPAKIKLDSFWGARSRRVNVGTAENAGFELLESWSKETINHRIDSLAKNGVKVLLVHYAVAPGQLPTIVEACKRNNIATMGELGLSSYHEAVAAGVQSFIHVSRYSADVLPDSARKAYATSPFGPPGQYYYQYIAGNPNLLSEKKFLELSQLYHDHAVGLIPTAGMLLYPEMDFAVNPWLEPIAAIIDEKDVTFEPLDKATGKPKNPSPNRQRAVPAMVRIDQAFVKNGAHYLTGSGTDAFGTLPGISLHNELSMLSHYGLTNRQVLAAATHNFSLLWNWTSFGKVERGREADILVLDHNPLESIKHLKAIHTLIVDGVVIDRDNLLTKK
ncbi:amidohydrolase family protein [Ohtaekwangia sp.]|uniref:amidohydrolase family protein n=1 Tax=Ohtaekwangia sp. TaxID=2066019 RepID=UPI002FDCB94E